MALTVGGVAAAMDRIFPPETAEAWDRVGLAIGELDAPVTTIGFAVDPTQATVEEAIERGADMLITHHPLYLRGTHAITSQTAKGRWTAKMIRHDLALFTAHTNADVAASTRALADLLGVRIERALDGESGIGGVGQLAEPMFLRDFGELVARVLPEVPAGVLVGGDPQRQVRTVAICSGSGDSFLGAANAAGADVYLTADLRHHPATDHLWDGGCALVCATHWASEWPVLDVMRRRLVEELAEQAPQTYVSTIPTDPWSIALRS